MTKIPDGQKTTGWEKAVGEGSEARAARFMKVNDVNSMQRTNSSELFFGNFTLNVQKHHKHTNYMLIYNGADVAAWKNEKSDCRVLILTS